MSLFSRLAVALISVAAVAVGSAQAQTGACCTTAGACSQQTLAGCPAPNTFRGVGTACLPNPCVATLGACCDAFGVCTVTSTGGCAIIPDGNFLGISTVCAPTNPCTASGACCIALACSITSSPSSCTSVGGVFFPLRTCLPDPCVRPDVRISQIYTAGGNFGATYRFDYVELVNRGTTAVDLTNWSLQFGAQTTTTFPSRVILNGTIQPGRYFLIQLVSANLANGAVLPVTADLNAGVLNLDTNGGRIALVSNPTPLPSGCPGSFPVNIVDFVGYGTTATCSEGTSPTGTEPGPIFALYRKLGGCQDTENNGNDFAPPAAPLPRNSASTLNCTVVATTGACCASGVCTVVLPGDCSVANFQGLGTVCSPTNPCTLPTGACCSASGCSITARAACPVSSTQTFSYGITCDVNPCSGVCCNAGACVATTSGVCTSPATFVQGQVCSPNPCPTPAAVLVGDIAYGASVSQAVDAVQQVRGAGSSTPARVGTWTVFPFTQSARFDSTGGTRHNFQGNLIGLNFGSSSATGGLLYNLPTNGASVGQTLFQFTGATAPFGLTRSRLGGLSVSPNNDRLAVLGYDSARVIAMSYVPGSAIGTGAGASIDGAAQTDPSSLLIAFNFTQGTTWIDNDNICIFVRTDQANQLKLITIPVTGSGASIALGTPVEQLTITDSNPNSSRFTALAYNPQLIPGYLFAMSSDFQGTTINTLYVIDVSTTTWTIAKQINLSSSLQTGRELAVGPDRALYLNQFAGSGTLADSAIIDRLVLDANNDGVVSPAEIAALGNNSSVDFYTKGLANTASFNGLDVAIGYGACCIGTSCSINTPQFCVGGSRVFQGVNTTCSPNPCNVLVNVLCCRGSTCSLVPAAACVTTGFVAGASQPGGTTCNVSGNNTTPCCHANYNKIDGVTVPDIFAFLADWFANSPYAFVGGDGTGSGSPGVPAIFSFLGAWFAGCP